MSYEIDVLALDMGLGEEIIEKEHAEPALALSINFLAPSEYLLNCSNESKAHVEAPFIVEGRLRVSF